MAFLPSIPQPTDDPKISQGQLLSNNQILNTRWAVNHVALTQSSNVGMHTQIHFNNVLGADPDLTTPRSSLYTKTSGGATELFFQNANGATPKQLTGLSVSTSGTNYTLLTPWNITIQMGTTSAGTGTFATPFVNANPTIYTAVATGSDCTDVKIATVTKTGFTYTAAGGSKTIRYLIIGWQ